MTLIRRARSKKQTIITANSCSNIAAGQWRQLAKLEVLPQNIELACNLDLMLQILTLLPSLFLQTWCALPPSFLLYDGGRKL